MRTKNRIWKEGVQSFSRYFPFTVGGTILFVLALLLLARSFLASDPYELVLALFALIVLGLLVMIGRLQAAQFAKLHIQWDTSVPIVATSPGSAPESMEMQRLTGVSIKPFFWYRLHFLVHGSLLAGREARMWISQTVSSSGEEVVLLPLTIPLCGIFDAQGLLSIGDIFGLTRAQFGHPFVRRISVEPAVFPEEITIRVEAAEKTEEKQSQLNSDEDKYYMREYAPGDRFRDINWKTSSRLHQLFTKIAPVALEQTKIIAVEFRNYREAVPETLDSVIHLSYLKSWLVSFIRTIKEQNPDFTFQVITGRGVKAVDSKEDIARFSDEIAGTMFQGDRGVVNAVPETDEIFIFTTPYDKLLPALLPRYPQRRINIVRTLTSDWTGGANRRSFPLLKPSENLPLPGWWAIRRDGRLRQPGVEHAGSAIVGQEVLETRLI